jgi:transposase
VAEQADAREIVSAWCCGLDVHAKTVVACRLTRDQKERRTFSTMPADGLRLADWLVNAGCTPVAIERTGVSGKPVFNILEGLMEVMLVNTRHIKAIPGHQTDARESAWLADLLRHGVLKARCLPPRHLRALRARTRSRSRGLRDQSAVTHRIQ